MQCRHTTLLLAMTALTTGLTAATPKVKLTVDPAHPYLLANQPNTTYVKVSLTGFALDDSVTRPAVNVAIVLDQSGSMSGEKMEKAKEAAIMAVNRLSDSDIVSIVAYSSGVTVLVPATRLTDRESVIKAIRALRAGGSTALFAGVGRGGAEVRKFLNREQVNRVVLLSDGLANVGPKAPGELAELGTSLGREGIAVTTIGLGLDYNEDLMTQLAGASDGNHGFAATAEDLAKLFDEEFGDILTVVAQNVEVQIECAPGVRPIRVLGREATIAGSTVHSSLNQVYSEQQKYVLLEVEVPASAVDDTRKLADAQVRYLNMASGQVESLTGSATVRFATDAGLVAERQHADVLTDAVQQIANDTNRAAVAARDAGNVQEAQQLLFQNSLYLRSNYAILKSPELAGQAAANDEDAEAIADDEKWKEQRKVMRNSQYNVERQRSRWSFWPLSSREQ